MMSSISQIIKKKNIHIYTYSFRMWIKNQVNFIHLFETTKIA